MSLEEHVSGVFLEVKLEGKISEPLSRLDGLLYRRIRFAFSGIGRDVYIISQSIVPVVTGFLKSTGGYKVYGRSSVRDIVPGMTRGTFWSVSVKVIYKAFYAVYVELGTRYFHGRRYLRQAWEFMETKIPFRVENAIRRAIERVRT